MRVDGEDRRAVAGDASGHHRAATEAWGGVRGRRQERGEEHGAYIYGTGEGTQSRE